jgi:hypothetical protein
MNDKAADSSLGEIRCTPRSPSDDYDEVDDHSHERAVEGNHNVSFGSVNIHKHRMTLSNNPATRIGLPVEIAWEEHSSELLNIDEYESSKTSNSLHRLPASTRRKIAEQHHTRESILRVEDEIKEAKKSIESSKLDKPGPKMFHCCVQ